MFRGSSDARVDEKGRLKLPADFKRICDEKYGSTFFITSLHGTQAEIYPMKEWEKIEAQVAGQAGPEKKRFLLAVNRFGSTVEMDGAGRLLLPQQLREKASLTGDTSVIGMQTHLTVINEKMLDTNLETEPVTDSDLAKLGIPEL